MTTFIVTALSMIAFAANSLLCRMALGGGLIDPTSFTTIRILSGAIALIPISRYFAKREKASGSSGSWISGGTLFIYALTFSLAYVTLTTGTGALILVGAVQVSMIGFALKTGERLGFLQWTGLAVAIGGLVYLLLPGISAPDPIGALLMGIAGIAWGAYSLRGKSAHNPIAMTAGNFLRAAPITIVASIALLSTRHFEPAGIVLALSSGAITSGLGYVIWYVAMRRLATSHASIIQLSVPVLAAIAGIIFLSEQLSMRLIVAGILILGGIALQKVNFSKST